MIVKIECMQITSISCVKFSWTNLYTFKKEC